MFSMKCLPPSTADAPKYLLPPYPSSQRAKWAVVKDDLMAAVEMLEENGYGHRHIQMLTSITIGILWSEDFYNKFLEVGLDISQELYNNATVNVEQERRQADPDNPSNWTVI